MADHPSNRPTVDSLADLFTHHPPGEREKREQAAYAEIRRGGEILAAAILYNCPACSDTTAAIRKVREAVMTANAAIALEPREEA